MTLDIIGLAGTRNGREHDLVTQVLQASTHLLMHWTPARFRTSWTRRSENGWFQAASRHFWTLCMRCFPLPASLCVHLDRSLSAVWLTGRQQTRASLAVARAREVLDRAGKDIVRDIKASIQSEKDEITRKDFEARDLLTLLIRANLANDLPESGRLSDQEVLDQVPVFLFAGHETTSGALASAFYALAAHSEIQDKLRAELRNCPTGDQPGAEVLEKLPYLDAFVRETLRLYSPVTAMVRVATKDDIIPTTYPWLDKNGVEHHDIQYVPPGWSTTHLWQHTESLAKDDSIFISTLALNRSKHIYGEDAYEFRFVTVFMWAMRS